MKKNILLWCTLIAVAVFLVLRVRSYVAQGDRCKAEGGVLVQATAFTYACVAKPEPHR